MMINELKPVTADRLAALQGVEWLFSFMNKYPKLLEMRSNCADHLFHGLIDTHVHANPDSLGIRSQDLADVAVDYSRKKAKAIVHKDHHFSTVGVAQATQRHLDEMLDAGQLQHRVEIYGGIPLAYTTDPKFVATATKSPFMRMIFMNAIYGEVLVDEQMKVRDQVVEIFRVAADAGVPTTLCPPNHSAKYAGADDFLVVSALTECAAKHKAKILLDQPISAFTIDQIKHLVACGAYAGIFCYPTIPDVIKAPVTDPELTRDLIRTVGPENCVLGSDKGYVLEPDAIQAMTLLLRLLIAWGFSDQDINAMAEKNASRLLYS